MQAFLFLALFALVPAGLLLFIRPIGRWVFFGLGLAVAFGTELVVQLGGPDSPMLVIPLIGFGVAVGALLVEAVAFPLRRRRRRREADAGD